MDQIRPTAEQLSARRGERLVARYRTSGLGVSWSPPTQGLFRLRPKPAAVEVIDLSVSGALLLGPRNPLVRRGTVVTVESDGTRGSVEVRHVHDHPEPGQQYYGVLFLELEPQLRDRLFRQVGALRRDRGALEGEWNHAR